MGDEFSIVEHVHAHMYAPLKELKSFLKMDELKDSGKVKEEPIEEAEYSEVKDGADLMRESITNGLPIDLNVKPETSEKEAVVVQYDNSGETFKVKKEPEVISNEDKVLNKCQEKGAKDLNENSKVVTDEASKKEEGGKGSSNYISDDSFKRNMHQMFPKIHADIIETFKIDFCGLCGAKFDSEKRAWTHYFSPEHDHALKKGKKFPFPPFWLMIKLALAEFKPAGATKRNIHDFLVNSYPGVKTLKGTEIYDKLGENLVEMVTQYKNVIIDDDGKYKLGRGRTDKNLSQSHHTTRYFQSDKRFFIPENEPGHNHPDTQQDSYKPSQTQTGYRYRNQVDKSRGRYEEERGRGYGERREGDRNTNSRRNRSRSRSHRKKEPQLRERSRDKESHSRRESYGHRENSRYQKRSSLSDGRKNRRSRSRQRKHSRSSRKSSEIRSEKIKVVSNPSPSKASPPPVLYQQPPLQMPMFSMPGSMEGGAGSQQIIIIPSNLSNGGFPPELLGGNLGLNGMQLFPANSMMPQFGRSFHASQAPVFPGGMFQMAPPGSAIPSPPLSAV